MYYKQQTLYNERTIKMKKVISLILIAMLCVTTGAFADEAVIGGADAATDILVAAPSVPASEDIAIKLIVDDKVVPTETVTVNFRTLVPLRALMESTGAQVEWINDTRSINVTRNGKLITLQIENSIMSTPDGDVALDAAPILHNGNTTYVPLRAVCEEFDFKVDWDEGTKTILVNAPDGCPYVDLYDGMTLAEVLANSGTTGEEFTAQTGMDYEEYKDMPYVLVDNSVTLSAVASMNSMTPEEIRTMFGLDSTIADDAKWGEVVGSLTMKAYIENLTPAAMYGMTADQALESLKDTYGLGDEYTLETKFRYVRTIMETKELEMAKELEEQQLLEEAKRAADLAALPELLKNTIKFTITMQDGSVMKGELYPDVAPATVENFVKLVNEKFYDGLIFHRIIDGFMLQGGGYDKDLNEKEAQSINGEFYSNGFTNALKHEKGILSMARTEDPNSASSQFFIMDEAAPHLDGQYAAFGKITDGLDVVEKLSKVETQTADNGMTDVPVKAVIIKSIRINK